jgi:hypothetical protein
MQSYGGAKNKERLIVVLQYKSGVDLPLPNGKTTSEYEFE